jgi:hypothetical protein
VPSLEERGLLAPVTPGVWQWTGDYDNVRGIGADQADPESFIA